MSYKKIKYRIKYNDYYVRKMLVSIVDEEKIYTPIMTKDKKKAEIYIEGVMEMFKKLNETYKMLGNIEFELEEVKDEEE